MTTRHTDALPAGSRIERRIGAAYRDGRETAAGRAPRVNPWSGTSTDARDRALAQAWTRGFSAGNRFTATDEAGEPIGTHGE